MRSPLSLRSRSRLAEVLAAGALAVGLTFGSAGRPGGLAQAATAPKQAERSVGSPTDGHLVGGARLEESTALRRYPTYAGDDVRWGLHSLVGAIERAARDVHRRFPDAVLSVGHLSRQGGGEVDRHASHESGRDADVGFYVKGVNGKPLLADHMVPFRGDGTATMWPGAHFDDARNWAFIAALLGDGHVHVSHLFLASPLRARLLTFAARNGASQALRDRAAEVLMQPRGALPHDDHFHFRVSCPPGMSGCVELPTRPRSRKNEPIRSRGQGQGKGRPSTTERLPAPHVRPSHHPVEPTEDPDPADPAIDLVVPVSPVSPVSPFGPPSASPETDPVTTPPVDGVDDVDGVLD